MKENKDILYLSMVGSAFLNAILLLFSTFYMAKEHSTLSYFGTFSCVLIIAYSYFLEERIGISKKMIGLKSIVSMLVFLVGLAFLTH